MEYRRIGRAGVQVSLLSLGSWITYGNQVDEKASIELMAAARDHGVNFFDNAEVYASGKSEELMGASLKRLIACRASRLQAACKPQGHARPATCTGHLPGVAIDKSPAGLSSARYALR